MAKIKMEGLSVIERGNMQLSAHARGSTQKAMAQLCANKLTDVAAARDTGLCG